MKKSMKKIIPAFLMLGVAASMMATSSYAWFSMSREANVTGMQVQATADSSLVIGTTFNDVTKPTVAFSGANKLAPITWVAEPTTLTGDPTSNYVTVSDTSKVDPNTGNALDGQNLTYANASSTNYKDYIVYLASAGSALTGGKLKATVTFTDSNGEALANEQKATTVDFYTKTASAEVTAPDGTTSTYRVATVNTVNNGQKEIASGEIPMNSSNTSLAVIMRVYIDGALKESEAENAPCWVKSSTVDLNAVNIKVDFTYGA